MQDGTVPTLHIIVALFCTTFTAVLNDIVGIVLLSNGERFSAIKSNETLFAFYRRLFCTFFKVFDILSYSNRLHDLCDRNMFMYKNHVFMF